MIAYLEGVVRSVDSQSVVVLAGPVGYRVYPVACQPLVGDTVTLDIYDHIREGGRELYGFSRPDVMRLFVQLISVSGIGPKLAQKMFNGVSERDIRSALLEGDVTRLTRLPGIGKKTAQKLILELRGVLVEEQETVIDMDETTEALLALGYAQKDIRSIADSLTAERVEDRVREALRLLSR